MARAHQEHASHRDNTNRLAFKEEGRATDAPCWICGGPIDYDAPPGDRYAHTRDHIKPASTHPELYEEPTNWAHAHHSCNAAKGNSTPTIACEVIPRWW